MDPAYFVGRAEILEWINATLQLKLTKVEETCTGAVACQIVDSLFPGVVQMNKVNWAAKSDWEYVANYKVLQAAFAQLKIDRYVDVDKLIKGKYQDNFEFCQWLKKFAANNETGAPYDALARRGLGKGASAIASRRTTLAQPPQSKAVAVKAPPRSVGAAVETRRVETSKPMYCARRLGSCAVKRWRNKGKYPSRGGASKRELCLAAKNPRARSRVGHCATGARAACRRRKRARLLL